MGNSPDSGGAEIPAPLPEERYAMARMARMAHDAGARFVLDAAQSAGALPLDMGALGVDALCFTGHKALLGPQGTDRKSVV